MSRRTSKLSGTSSEKKSTTSSMTETSFEKKDKIKEEKKGKLQGQIGNKKNNLQGKLSNKASKLQGQLGNDPSSSVGLNTSDSNKSPQLTQNVPNKLPLKPSTLTPNARKLEYKMYKEAFVILRFQKINLTLTLMTKITKKMQTNIRNEFKQKLQKLTKNIPNKKNKELKIFKSVLGTIQNNFQKIETINASSLSISQQNKKNTLDSLIKELFQQFKTVPENVTKKEKIIIYYYLQTLINQLYFLYNIDLSEKNNKNIYNFGAFYQLMIGELKNIEDFSSLSESTNVKIGGENNKEESKKEKSTKTSTNTNINTSTNTNTKTNTNTNPESKNKLKTTPEKSTNTNTNKNTNKSTNKNTKKTPEKNTEGSTKTNIEKNTEGSTKKNTSEKTTVNNSPGNVSKQKFILLKQGLLLYRLTLILGLLESMKKICTTIQTKFTNQYKKNLASFKNMEGVTSYQIQDFSQAISMFGNHFNKVTRLNEKRFFMGMENSEISPLKKNILNNLMNQLNNNFKTVPLESTKNNKVQIQYLLQNIILELFYLFSKNLDAKNASNFSVNQFFNQLIKKK